MDSFGVLLGCFVVENDDDEERPIERNSTEFARRFSEPPTMTFDEDGIPSMNPTARGHFLPPYGNQTSTARRVSNGPRLVARGNAASSAIGGAPLGNAARWAMPPQPGAGHYLPPPGGAPPGCAEQSFEACNCSSFLSVRDRAITRAKRTRPRVGHGSSRSRVSC